MSPPRASTLSVTTTLSVTLSLALSLALSRGPAACGRRPPSDVPAELWFAGDVHLGAGLPRLFDTPPAVLRGAVGVVNLEGAVVDGPSSASAERLTSTASALAVLRAAGVGVVTVANNHARDPGASAPEHTVRAARRAGLSVAGGPAGEAVLALGSQRVVIAAYDLSAGVPPGLAGALAAARGRGDALVVGFHVQAPALYLPVPALRRATEMALAAGARVVVAHGTHTVAPVERRGDAVVAWGLGNLVFACDCTRETEGAVLRVSLGAHGVRAAVVPVEAGLDGRPAVLPADPTAAFDLLRALGGSPLRVTGPGGWF